jgi:hypothetical protein
MPTKMTIKMIGIINLFAPLELPGNINVLGDDTSSAAVQFSYLGSSGFSVYPGAYPGIIISGPDVYQRNIDVGGVATNGGLLEVAYGQNDTWDGGALVGAGTSTSDYLSMPIELISGASGGQQYYFHQMLFNGGPTQILDASWTPLVYYSIARNSSGGYLENQNYSFYCDKCFFNLRGVEQELHGGNGGNWQFVDSYRQGGITPWLLIGNTTGVVKPLVIFNNTIQDTESVGSFAAIGGTSQTVAAYINAIGLYNSSVDGGSNTAPPPFSGYRPESVVMESSTSGKPPNRNTEATQDLSANIQPYNISEFPAFQPIKNIYEALAFQGQYPWYYPLGSPTITSAAVQSGTGVVNDTYQFVVTAIGPEGSESAPSAPSSAVTTTGNGGGSPMSRIQLHWTNPPGTISNNLYVCGIYGKCPRDFRGTALNLTTNSYLFQHDNSNGTPPQVSGTGTTGATPALIYAPKLRMVGPLNDNGVSPTGDMKYVGRASVVYAVGLNAIRYSTTPALDLTKGNVQQFSCTSSGASISPTITGLGAGLEFTVIFVQNSSKACTWNWPAHIYGGMTVSSTLSGINVQKFIVSDNGTDAYAEAAGSVGVTGGTP